jgi:hypothetical protein
MTMHVAAKSRGGRHSALHRSTAPIDEPSAEVMCGQPAEARQPEAE